MCPRQTPTRGRELATSSHFRWSVSVNRSVTCRDGQHEKIWINNSYRCSNNITLLAYKATSRKKLHLWNIGHLLFVSLCHLTAYIQTYARQRNLTKKLLEFNPWYLLIVWQPAGSAFKGVPGLWHVAEVSKPSRAVTAAAERTAVKRVQRPERVCWTDEKQTKAHVRWVVY